MECLILWELGGHPEFMVVCTRKPVAFMIHALRYGVMQLIPKLCTVRGGRGADVVKMPALLPALHFLSHSLLQSFGVSAICPLKTPPLRLFVLLSSALYQYHADIALSETTELGVVTNRWIGESPGGPPHVIAKLPYRH